MESENGTDKEIQETLMQTPECNDDSIVTSDVIEESIEEVIEIIDQDPARAKTELQLIKKQLSMSYWSGPLPRPSEFGEYGHYVPDAPERILQMTENEQGHRHETDLLKLKHAIHQGEWDLEEAVKNAAWERKMQLVGFLMAFILALVFIGCATYLLSNGKEIGGFVSLGAGLTVLIGPFIYWRTRSTKNNSTN